MLRQYLGQVLVVGDFSVSEDLNFSLSLNDFYPTVTYDKGGRRSLTEEDKNIPMNITLFKLPDTCRNCSVASLNLLLMAKFANSGQMKTSSGMGWTTLEEEELRTVETLLCGPDITTHSYVSSDSQIEFLVLENSNKCSTELDVQFVVANQRQSLTAPHSLSALNASKTVRLVSRCVHHTQSEIEDQNLMEWLYLKQVILSYYLAIWRDQYPD